MKPHHGGSQELYVIPCRKPYVQTTYFLYYYQYMERVKSDLEKFILYWLRHQIHQLIINDEEKL